MLTPKCRPRDFRVRARPNLPKKCLYRFKPNLRGRNPAGIREEFDGLARDRESFNINALFWLCWEAAANTSLQPNYLITRKIQGIIADLGSKPGGRFVFRHINQCLVAKFPTHKNRVFFRGIRELRFGDQGTPPRLSYLALVLA